MEHSIDRIGYLSPRNSRIFDMFSAFACIKILNKMNQESAINNRGALIKGAALTGMIGNGLLAILKTIAGIISGSVAVVADGIDSATDILTSIAMYFAISISSRPPDKKHPWGYQRIETIATKVIAYIIIFAGFQLVITTVGRFFREESSELPGMLALAVTLLSIAGKTGISLYQHYIGKKTNSSMVRAEAANMRNDIFLSTTVLIGLGATHLTNLLFIDTILGIALGIWIIWSGIIRSFEANTELMDSFENQKELYKNLFELVKRNPLAHNPHRVRIRKINNLFDINLDIEVDGALSVIQAHNIAQSLEHQIRQEFVDVYDIVIHTEPIGNVEAEQFGLSAGDF